MPSRQTYHKRLLYLSEQMFKLERLGFFDKNLYDNINEEYKDNTLFQRILVIIGLTLFGALFTIIPAFFLGYTIGAILRPIVEDIMLVKLFNQNQEAGWIIVNLIDFAIIFVTWIVCTAPFCIAGVCFSISIKKSSKQKKIDEFVKNSQRKENNLKEARKIYEEIREDLVNCIPTEYRNSKDLRRLSDCFALYNISSIPEAVELIKIGKV